ncbi:hypothetical protein VTK73DRAFT_2992 [Phialemonium thermophilum]|uniref:Lysosomal cobalamin transporter n=1 Tax=Phialemonium thermophilum TaxID=223376 RepID=A0ABR3Y148_9PEZI
MMALANPGPPVGSEVFAALALLVISFIVILILRYYLPLRTTPAYLLVPVFFALWLPAYIVILMPIDLASSARHDGDAPRGIWLPDRLLLISWRITYWLTFVLTWFILPILAEYSDSGYREPKDRILYSLRQNAQYHLVIFGSAAIGLIYVFISYGVSFSSLKGLVMSLAYCWGLALVIYLMGHGLVAIPRRLFRNASISGRLRRIQAHAPMIYEKLEEAEMALEDLEMQVSELGRRKVGSARNFRDWIEELVEMVELPESHPTARTNRPSGEVDRILPTVITEKYMADLTRRLIRARHARCRYVDEWSRLVESAVETQAILDSAASKKLDFGQPSPHGSFWSRLSLLTPYTRYLLHYRIVPYLRIGLSVLFSFASASIVWSEMVKVALPSLSVIRLTVVHHWNGKQGQVGFAGQVIAALWLVYMCAAALTSITEVKVWRGRALVRRNTAHESAFWYSSQVARLSIPLSYNFMTFLSPEVYKETTFYRFLGRLITMTTASTWFDYLFPVFILFPVCATLFGLYGRVKRLFGFGLDVIEDGDENDNGYGTGSWREGRDLIKRELNGTLGRGRRDAVRHPPGGASGARSIPVLSMPGDEGGSSASPLSRSPNSRQLANTSARRTGTSSSAGASGAASRLSLVDAPEENFFESLGHRLKNTIDTMDTPKWFQGIGQGIKKPKWMETNDGNGSSSSAPSGPGADVRRWFGGGGGEGRIRL